jgi:hypothetical protein
MPSRTGQVDDENEGNGERPLYRPTLDRSQGESTIMDKPMTSILTLGYDFEQKKYVGTWVGSCMTYVWQYEGSVNLAAQTLTLKTEGPCPQSPGTVPKFKEVMEVKSK